MKPHWSDLLGPEIGWLTVCGFQPEGVETRCGETAKWHLWLAEGQGYIGACDGHIASARALLELTDEHAWGRWCNLPGSVWLQRSLVSWCDQLDMDPFRMLAEEPEPVDELLMCC